MGNAWTPLVTPHAGVRIEIAQADCAGTRHPVTPHAGVRIEIVTQTALEWDAGSPPTRGCELKYEIVRHRLASYVTPHAGVRIEIRSPADISRLSAVTPHAGVRIEIKWTISPRRRRWSPPTRGCELKSETSWEASAEHVTPHAGVRIEIPQRGRLEIRRRSPPTRGCELK